MTAVPGPRDWFAWHRAYDVEDSPLSHRLAIVQRCVRDALTGCPPGPIRVISMCAGQGRDLIGALSGHARASDVRARLVELDPRNCEPAREAAPENVDVVGGDASSTSAYAGAVPAEVVLVNGVFGNITDDHIERTIRTLPSLCAPAATVVWTRHRRPPDRTVDIRAWFADAGFREVTFEGVEGSMFGVGAARLEAPPAAFAAGVKMFDFLDSDQNWNPTPEPA